MWISGFFLCAHVWVCTWITLYWSQSTETFVYMYKCCVWQYFKDSGMLIAITKNEANSGVTICHFLIFELSEVMTASYNSSTAQIRASIFLSMNPEHKFLPEKKCVSSFFSREEPTLSKNEDNSMLVATVWILDWSLALWIWQESVHSSDEQHSASVRPPDT